MMTMRMTQFPTTPRTCLWDGMESQSHTGCTRLATTSRQPLSCLTCLSLTRIVWHVLASLRPLPSPHLCLQLHGLNFSYKCEICGNYSYQGRRDFDRHFREWRHSYAMRCLGIPNSRHFHDVTKIEDARACTLRLRRAPYLTHGRRSSSSGAHSSCVYVF